MQARRKNSKIVSFLCPVSLLAEVDAAVFSQQANTLMAPLSGRSEWIIRAIRRDLAHRERSKRNGTKDRNVSQRPVPLPALDIEATGLPGQTEGTEAAEAPAQRPAYGARLSGVGSLEEALQTPKGNKPSPSDAGEQRGGSPAESPGHAGLSHNDSASAAAVLADNARRRTHSRVMQYLQEQ